MASHRAYLPSVSSPVARKRYTSPTTATVRPSAGLRMTNREALLIGFYSTRAWSRDILLNPSSPRASLRALGLDRTTCWILHQGGSARSLLEIGMCQRNG